METKTVNELIEASKSTDPVVLGKAYARTVSLARNGDINLEDFEEMPPIINLILQQVAKVFNRKTGNDIEPFTKYASIVDWADRFYAFIQGQQASFQRDSMLLKSFANSFLLAEKVIQSEPNENSLNAVKSSSVDSYIKGLTDNPFDDEQATDDGLLANDRIRYSFCWVTAYNIVLEIASKIHEVPELVTYKVDISDDVNELKEISKMFCETARLVNDSKICIDDEKFTINDKIAEFNSFVEQGGCELSPTPDAVATVTKMINDFTAFDENHVVFKEMFPAIKEVLADV